MHSLNTIKKRTDNRPTPDSYRCQPGTRSRSRQTLSHRNTLGQCSDTEGVRGAHSESGSPMPLWNSLEAKFALPSFVMHHHVPLRHLKTRKHGQVPSVFTRLYVAFNQVLTNQLIPEAS